MFNLYPRYDYYVWDLERIGREGACVQFLLQGLRERGIVYRESVEDLPGT